MEKGILLNVLPGFSSVMQTYGAGDEVKLTTEKPAHIQSLR